MDRLTDVIKKVKNYEPDYFEVWWSGSRGFHFHIYDKYLSLIEGSYQRNKIRKHVLKELSADLALASEKHMVALEGAPNHKTGKLKILVCSSKGYWNNEFFMGD